MFVGPSTRTVGVVVVLFGLFSLAHASYPVPVSRRSTATQTPLTPAQVEALAEIQRSRADRIESQKAMIDVVERIERLTKHADQIKEELKRRGAEL